MTTSVHLPDRVEQLLSAYCVETTRSKSEVIVELLEQQLGTVNVEASPYQRALEAGFIGCMDRQAQPHQKTTAVTSPAYSCHWAGWKSDKVELS